MAGGAIQVFRTRAVVVAGIVDLLLGVGIVATGLALLAWWGNRGAVPVGLAVSLVGLLLLLNGFGRVSARLEITDTSLDWRWGVSRHSVALVDLQDAALVEKGAPAPGASWAGLPGGGLYMVLVWWLASLVGAFVRSEPSLGPLDLVVIKHVGAPQEIKVISAWSTRNSHSQANEALDAVKRAIGSTGHQAERHLGILQHDAWEG